MSVLLGYDRQENVGWVGLIVVNGVGGLFHFFLIIELTPRIGVNIKSGIVATGYVQTNLVACFEQITSRIYREF